MIIPHGRDAASPEEAHLARPYIGVGGSVHRTIVPNKDGTLRDLLTVFSRRRKTIYGTLAVVFLCTLLFCVFATRKYEASSVVQLQKSSADGMNLESMMGTSNSGNPDSLSVNVDLQTQSTILKSDSLALKVIKDLDLEKTKDFQNRFSIMSWLLSPFAPKLPAEPIGASLDDSPRRRQHLLNVFNKNLQVGVIAGTRLIEVRYTSSDPKQAAAIVNHIVQELIDYTFRTKFAAANQVSQWLEGQLGDLRKQSESLQTKVAEAQKETGLFGISGSDLQGRPVVFSPVLQQLQQATNQLSESSMNRILKGAVYEAVKSGNAELISQLSGNGLTVAGTNVASALTVIQSLRSREAALQEQISQDASKFGPAYPKLIEERAALQQTEQSLQEEIARTAARAKSDFEVAVSTEQGTQRKFAEARSQAEKLNAKTIEYSIVEREATQSQQLYQDLLRRLREAGIVEGLKASNLAVTSAALVPAMPSSPRVAMDLAIGLGLGLFLGCCGAMFVDAVDNRLFAADDVEAMQLPVLCVLPQFSRKTVLSQALLPNKNEKDTAYVEAIRGLRSVLLIPHSGKPPKVILVTSGSSGEGKSTMAMNLAASLAQFEKKVLLVEADMRRPVLQDLLVVTGGIGLSKLLSDKEAKFELAPSPLKPYLWVVPAGPVPRYPAELLNSDRFKCLVQQWRKEFDFVVIDSPPVLHVVDPQIIQNLVDATVVVARAGMTARAALQQTYKTLLPHAKDPARPGIGVVVSGFQSYDTSYYRIYKEKTSSLGDGHAHA